MELKMNSNTETFAMTILNKQFDKLANGEIQIPKKELSSSLINTTNNYYLFRYKEELINNSGPLFKHFLASIPNILEELCRIGVSIININKTHGFPIKSYWEVESFDGSNGRALNSLSIYDLSVLSNSPNKSNEKYFNKYNKNSNNIFISGSYLDAISKIKKDDISNYKFDFIYEMAAFQFYGKRREEHIKAVKDRLSQKGLAIFLEKLDDLNINNFLLKEDTKDWEYKTRYFTKEEIIWKRENMLKEMHEGIITLDSFSRKLSDNFNYVALIWNSTNFYELLASNDASQFYMFLEEIKTPVIESKFQFFQPTIIKG